MLQKEIEEKEEKIDTMRNGNAELVQHNEALDAIIADLKAQLTILTETSDEAVSTWRKQVEDLNAATHQSHSMIETLRQQVADANAVAQTSEATIVSLREQIKEYEEKLESAKRDPQA